MGVVLCGDQLLSLGWWCVCSGGVWLCLVWCVVGVWVVGGVAVVGRAVGVCWVGVVGGLRVLVGWEVCYLGLGVWGLADLGL